MFIHQLSPVADDAAEAVNAPSTPIPTPAPTPLSALFLLPLSAVTPLALLLSPLLVLLLVFLLLVRHFLLLLHAAPA